MERFSYQEKPHLWKPELRENSVILPHSGNVFLERMSGKEEEPSLIVPYKEWKAQHYEAEVGSLVVDVPPAVLFTPQSWLQPEKMVKAVEAQEENTPDAFTVKGIIYTHPKPHMGRVPVVLNGNHRAVNALIHGNHLNFHVIEYPFDEKPVWRMPNLRNRNGDLLVR